MEAIQSAAENSLTSKFLIDERGNRYGRLVVVGRAKNSATNHVMWNCVCDCGGKTITSANTLRQGQSKSCGCLMKELLSKRSKTHGKSKTKQYSIWRSMLRRCYDKSCKYYSYYGGRGITVCKRWRVSYQNFLDDMGDRPSDGHSIDRVNNNGNYTKKNCRWATRFEQHANTRRSTLLTYGEVTMCIRAWERHLGLSYGLLRRRLSRGEKPPHAFRLAK